MVTEVTGSSSRVTHISQEKARIKLNKAATFPSKKVQGIVGDVPVKRKLPVVTEKSGKQQEVRNISLRLTITAQLFGLVKFSKWFS